MAEEAGTDAGAGAGAGETPPAAGETPGTARDASGRFGVQTYDAMDWRQGLSDEIRGNPDLTKTLNVYKDPNHFVRDALGWRGEMTRRVRLPAQDAKAEEWQAYYKQLPGYPEKPVGYKDLVKLPELPKGPEGEPAAAWDDSLIQQLYEQAYVEGMTAKQVESVLGLYARMEANARNVLDAQMAEVEQGQQRERYTRFGASTRTEEGRATAFFQRLTQDTELGKSVAEKLREARLPDGGKVLNDADIVQFFALATQRWGSEPEMLGLESQFSPLPTAEELQGELDKWAGVALDEKQSPDARQAAVRKMLALSGDRGALTR
jgi:hypothetical protein